MRFIDLWTFIGIGVKACVVCSVERVCLLCADLRKIRRPLPGLLLVVGLARSEVLLGRLACLHG